MTVLEKNLFERLSTAVRGGTVEHRPQQETMAAAVRETLNAGGVLLVEAGTGVGKSFAYLLPALDRVLKTGRTIAVSTHTLTLQEQLLKKDLPVLNKVLEKEGRPAARVVLLKGRGNYLSKRRLKALMEAGGQGNLWMDSEKREALQAFALRAQEGTRQELDFPVTGELWAEVQSDPFHCMGQRCPTYSSCFYYTQKKAAEKAQLLLINHALLLSDLALRLADRQPILPELDALIVDEAHHLPALAADHLAVQVSRRDALRMSRRLLHGGGEENRGLFTLVPLRGAGEAVQHFQQVVEGFFERFALQAKGTADRSASTSALPDSSMDIPKELQETVERLENFLDQARQAAPTEETQLEAQGHLEELREWMQRLSLILNRAVEVESSYVLEKTNTDIQLKAVPLFAGEWLREGLFASSRAVVLTSATLSVGGDFRFLRRRLGLEEEAGSPAVHTLSVGSPFDYRRQVTLAFPQTLPHPRREESAFWEKCHEYIREAVSASRGRAFVLFTSYRAMLEAENALRPHFEKKGLSFYRQGEGGFDRTRLLEAFRCDGNAVLFGVASFWEGVDVPGDALSNLIIPKLPFASPDDPVTRDRHAWLKKNGVDPFREESLPEAVLRLRQGFGRLIRTAEDRGFVFLLDPRLHTERWGKIFLDALPDCRKVFLRTPKDARALIEGEPAFNKKGGA